MTPSRAYALLYVALLSGVIFMSAGNAEETQGTITVDSMVKIVFTGDSQSCGRNLAIDFPQLVSRLIPARVINTAVGGSNSDALLKPMTGGRVRIRKGENILYGENVSWGMGPYPGMKVTVNGETYTMDHVVEHPKRVAELHLCEPARADYEGTDCVVEPGWEVRVARHKPDVVCLMYINDGDMPEAKQANWREMIRRIREMGAVPVLMSPVPVDDSAHGGNHPGSNQRYAKNAETVREIGLAPCAHLARVHVHLLARPRRRHDGNHRPRGRWGRHLLGARCGGKARRERERQQAKSHQGTPERTWRVSQWR
jgi:hypothetical protein